MDLSWLLGYAKTTFHASEKPISLPLKAAKGDATSSISLTQLCRSVTPPCQLNPLIPGGHLQTIWAATANTAVPIYYRRKAFESTDARYPGTFVVDFVCEHEDQQAAAAEDEGHIKENPKGMKVADAGTHGSGFLPPRTVPFTRSGWSEMEQGSDDSTPMLIALHGLSGGSYELYLREALWPLTAGAKEGDQKWKVCVVNARGCAGSNVTSGVMFNARATWDCRQMVKWCREKFPNRPLFGIGFSLGGNILTNVGHRHRRTPRTPDSDPSANYAYTDDFQYLGEEGEKCELTAAVVCSNPFDLSVGSKGLLRTWIGREVYSKAMGANLKKLFKKHQETLQKNPKVNVERVLATKYLHEFDRELQGPTWGYPTEGAYYRDASSVDPLLGVRIPLLAVHAEDDPVAVNEAMPYEEFKQNPFTVMVTTSMGGHLGWFEPGGGRWFPRPAAGFLRKIAEDVDIKTLNTKVKSEGSAACMRPAAEPQFNPSQRRVQL